MQEEDLKKVLGYLPKGTLFDFNSFSRAVRMKQNVEEYRGCKSPERRRPHDKYEIEVQIAGTIMMKNQFTSKTSGCKHGKMLVVPTHFLRFKSSELD